MAKLSADSSFQVGEWFVDPRVNRIRGAHKEVTLEPRVMELLAYLAERAGEVVSAEDLLRDLWPGQIVGDDSVYQSIAKLRKALGDSSDSPKYIATIPKRGYTLTAPVRVSSAPEAPVDSSATRQPASVRRSVSVTKAVLLLLVLGAVVFATFLYFRPSSEASRSSLESIAVLPFVNLSSDDENTYFAEGISEEILNALARVPDLRVVARTSSFAFKGANRDVRDIGRKLTADAVLEGSVRKSADRLRINVQLVDARSGFELWGASFDRALGDIFDVQEEIAQHVLEALQLTPDEQRVHLTSDAVTSDITAYEFYLLGRHYFHTRSRESLYKSADMYRRALARDANYAPAQAGFGTAYLLLSQYGDISLAEAIKTAGPAINKASRLNPQSAETRGARGLLKYLQRDYKGAQSDFQRAIEVNHSFAQAYVWLGSTFMKRGQLREAMSRYEQALSLDPLNVVAVVNYSHSLDRAGHYAEATERLERAVSLVGAAPQLYRVLAWVSMEHGRFRDGFRWAKKAVDIDPKGALGHAMLGYAYAVLGQFQIAAEWFDKAVEAAPDSASVIELQQLRFLESGNFEAFNEYAQRLVKNSAVQPNPLSASSRRWPVALAGTASLLVGDFRLAAKQLDDVLSGEAEIIYRTDLDAYYCTNRAYAYAQLGDAASTKAINGQCRERIAHARERGWSTGWLAYSAARLLALSGERDQVLEALKAATTHDFLHYGIIAHDPVFASYQGEAAYEQMLNQLRVARDEAVADLKQGGSL